MRLSHYKATPMVTTNLAEQQVYWTETTKISGWSPPISSPQLSGVTNFTYKLLVYPSCLMQHAELAKLD